MKTLFYSLIIIVTFISCSKNDNDIQTNPNLIGKWQLVEKALLYTDEIDSNNPIDNSWKPVTAGYTYQFNKNGTFSSTEFTEKINGTYTIDKNNEIKLISNSTAVHNYSFDKITIENNTPTQLTLKRLGVFVGNNYKFKRMD
jgi:hypothetical protein